MRHGPATRVTGVPRTATERALSRSQTAGVPPVLEQQLFDARPALTVSALLGEVRRVIGEAFPSATGVWVRGEIQRVTDHRSGHCYIDLVDPDAGDAHDAPVLKVNCWRSTWGPLKRVLADRGITLCEGMVVTLRGRVDLYAQRAQVNLVVSELDVDALLGRLAAERAALLRRLEAEGLLRANAGRPLSPVPLLVGLVAAPGSEGFRDCTGQLLSSAFGFRVRHVPVPVQGTAAARAVAAAVGWLGHQGCDVVVVVRGGGARADLAAFDAEVVARAIAACPVPVWTGIGHSGDQSVADIVAHRAFVTPTECGQALVRAVDTWWQGRASAAGLVARRAAQVVEQAAARDAAARGRLVACTRSQLRGHEAWVQHRAERLGLAGPRAVASLALALQARSARLAPVAAAILDRRAGQVESWRRLLGAYDIERQLRRGYSLTLDAGGRPVRSAAAVAPGDRLVTRLADGELSSVVDDVVSPAGTPPAATDAGEGPTVGTDGQQGLAGRPAAVRAWPVRTWTADR